MMMQTLAGHSGDEKDENDSINDWLILRFNLRVEEEGDASRIAHASIAINYLEHWNEKNNMSQK